MNKNRKRKKTSACSKLLPRSNKDFEQFAHIVSHDLRAPLVGINNYAQLLARRYKEKLDPDAKNFIDCITGGVTRMSRLIEDLALYSKLSAKTRPLKKVDCAGIIKEVLETLSPAVKKSNAVITYENMPKIRADAAQINRLFQNLLDNAVKFCADTAPRVYVSARKQKNKWLFSIKDNGVGIDPKYKDYVFKMFTRIKEDDFQNEGTGAGLAICKKIVERHNGKIWVKSKQGKGSAFYFTIPAA